MWLVLMLLGLVGCQLVGMQIRYADAYRYAVAILYTVAVFIQRLNVVTPLLTA